METDKPKYAYKYSMNYHKLLQESTLTVRQPFEAPITILHII